jgi:uncharacterized membrane protein
MRSAVKTTQGLAAAMKAGIPERQQTRVSALRRHRQLRRGLVQLGYIVLALALAFAIPHLTIGPAIPAATARNALFAIAAGMIPFTGLLMSLVFVVVQWTHSMFSPRLSLFRDDRLVWHAFGLFVGTVTNALAAGLLVADRTEVSAAITLIAFLAVLGSFAVATVLQRRALGLIQLPTVLDALGRRGAAVIDRLYPDPLASPSSAVPDIPPVTQTLRAATDGYIQEIDTPGLVALAETARGIIRMHVIPGDSLADGDTVLSVSAPRHIQDNRLRNCLAVGIERTFTQDPRNVFRLLADIAVRALSPAVNDPTTAVQALDIIERLLRRLGSRDLHIIAVPDTAGIPRVVLPSPGWEDYISVALDEIRLYRTGAMQVTRRLISLLQRLIAELPEPRRAAAADRLDRLHRSIQQAYPDPGDQAQASIPDPQGLGMSAREPVTTAQRGDQATPAR